MPPHIWKASGKPIATSTAGWKTISLGVLLGWLSGLVMLAIGAVAFIALGVFDVAATTPQTDWTGWITHTTMIRSVKMRASGAQQARSPSRSQIEAGFRLYQTHCVECHGAPGVSRARWVMGLNPTPPYLLDAAREWSPSRLHFIIAEGIKMTAMPGWRLSLSDRELWDLTAFVEALHGLTAGEYQQLRTAQASAGKPTPPQRPVPAGKR